MDDTDPRAALPWPHNVGAYAGGRFGGQPDPAWVAQGTWPPPPEPDNDMWHQVPATSRRDY